ncbi:hypothetical protein EV356DRAFT_344439 [Viridothelium virens]|uniref:Uncharacterized protein n=1 Tax=Viridothelium virens TaxID=1048519 RepID=A0A6A6GX77_VIRVR|nr:hypothetical protein EV356DRAFT_344439 [Viridothelium virens]
MHCLASLPKTGTILLLTQGSCYLTGLRSKCFEITCYSHIIKSVHSIMYMRRIIIPLTPISSGENQQLPDALHISFKSESCRSDCFE